MRRDEGPDGGNAMQKMLNAFALAAALVGCRPSPPPVEARTSLAPGEKTPRTDVPFDDAPDRFQFAVVTDRTGGHRPGIFEDAIAKLNLLRPEFVMSVGDLIEGYTEDESELDREWTEFQSFTARLTMPFFYVPGNHDLSNATEVAKWKERFGRLYWHFVYRNVLFLCLDSEDPPDTHIGDEQIAYVKRALDENPTARHTLLFLHKPLWVIEERNAAAGKASGEASKETGWSKIEALLANRAYTVFAGHFHHYTKYVRNDRRYFVLATTGGASELRGPSFGEFDHVAWVTMGKDGPVVANLMLGGIWDENVTTEQSRARVASLEHSVKIGALLLGVNDVTFSGGTVPIKLTNDADQPLRVEGRFHDVGLIRPDPAQIDEIVPPNSIKQIDLKLGVGAPLKATDLPALTLKTRLSYDVAGGPKLAIESVHTIAPDHVAPVGRRALPIVVDGNLDDWKELPFVCEKPRQILGDADGWQGPADASFRFGLQYDDQNLYLAVQATDERLISLPDKPPWEQDGIEIRLDARPDPERSLTREDDSKVLFIAAAPGERREQSTVLDRNKLPPGVQVASAQTKGGHATEVAIPASYLDGMQGAPWKRIRLNIAVFDLDEPAGRPTQIWWRPGWRTDENYAGSGTFERKP
jgi:hypothetical protein